MENSNDKMKKVLVIGAGRLQTKTIKLVKELGYYCLCVDGNPESEGFKIADEHRNIDVLDTEACLSYAKERGIDGVTTTSATITLSTVARIAQEMGLVGIDPNVVEILKSKYEIKKKLYNSRLNNAGFFADISTPDMVEKAKQFIQYPAVIKPSDGSGSKGISIVHNPGELAAAIEYAIDCSRTKNIYIETFVEGTEYGVECFVFKGEIIVYGVIKQTFKWNNNGNFECGHCIPSGLSIDIEEGIKQEVIRAIQCLGVNHGSVNMDIMLSKNNIPYIIDVGARIGLNQIAERIIPLASGVNILSNTIKSSVGDESSFKSSYSRPVASRLLIFEPGIIKSIGDYKKLIDGEKVLDIIVTAKPGDVINPYRVKSDTCGWVITTAKSIQEAEFLANTLRDEIAELFEYERVGNYAKHN